MSTEAAREDAPRAERRARRVLFSNVLVVASCALVYELLCGTLASYMLGDAVRQFSLVLGNYLFAMGAGAWLSKRLRARAASRYVEAELLLAIVGGLSVPLLLVAAGSRLPLAPVLHAFVFAIGALVGLELPLLIRILEQREAGEGFKDTVGRAFAYDYVGALAASLLFPLVLVPRLGLVRTGILTGAVNALAALSATFVARVERPLLLRAAGAALVAVLAALFALGERGVALLGGAVD